MPNHSYNSVNYASIGTNNYFVFLVNQTFVERYENVSSPEVLLIGTMKIGSQGMSLLGT